TRNSLHNIGVGGFGLPSQGDDEQTSIHLLQLIDSQIVGERAVTEARFQYVRNCDTRTPQSLAPALRVTGAFTGGGSSRGTTLTHTETYEFQSNTSVISGPHIVKFGGRLRAGRLDSSTTNNFNGTYTFASLTAYQLTLQGQAQGLTAAQIRANGGGANQF